MKRSVIILFWILATHQIYSQDNFEICYGSNPIFNMLDRYEYDTSSSQIETLTEKYNYSDKDINSVKSLNSFGFFLYEKKQYSDALTVFRKAVMVDASYVYAHYNLACVLGLLFQEGMEIDQRELITHLQFACLLKDNYLQKMRIDNDLNSIRNEKYYLDFIGLIDNGKVVKDGETVYLKYLDNEIFISDLIPEEFIPPLGIGPEYESSPDGRYNACVAYLNGNANVFIITHYGLIIKATQTPIENYESIARCRLLWQPESKGLLFVNGSSLCYFDISKLRLNNILTAPIEKEDIKFYDFGNYWFDSPNVVRFMGGTYFEYSFAGVEYEINLDGSGLRLVPEGTVIEGEDLRGGDF